MNQVRKMRMTKHQSFHNMVLENLKNISESQAQAFAYWISTGNLSSVNPINKTYPNVTLTCLNPILNLGKHILLEYKMFQIKILFEKRVSKNYCLTSLHF